MLRTLLVVLMAVASAPASAQVLNIGNASVTEGGVATFSVTLSPTTLVPVTVQYATSDGTASSSGTGVGEPDYVAASGVILFPPGSGLQTVPITTLGDIVDESNETFTVDLSSPSGASLGDAQGSGSIIDDDTAELSISDAAAEEGQAVEFHVTLNVPSVGSVVFSYSTSDGTAVSSGTGPGEPDYLADSSILVFGVGETSKLISVDTVDDDDLEDPETFTVDISSFGGVPVADGEGVGTITDDGFPHAVPTLPPWGKLGVAAALVAGGRAAIGRRRRGASS